MPRQARGKKLIGARRGHDENHISILSAARGDSENESIVDDQLKHSAVPLSDLDSSERGTISANSISRRALILTAAVGLLGALSAAMFISFGLVSSANEQEQRFHHLAEEMALQVDAAWSDYESAARWLHQACAFQNISRQNFRDLYEYMTLDLEVEVCFTVVCTK
jgi:hypothetical protein